VKLKAHKNSGPTTFSDVTAHDDYCIFYMNCIMAGFTINNYNFIDANICFVFKRFKIG